MAQHGAVLKRHTPRRAGAAPILHAALAVLLLASCAFAIEIRQTVWGFDGQFVPERFNILSIYVDNPSLSPFDGHLVLARYDTVGRRAGEEFVESCFLSPGAGRWIQFCIYMPADADTWRLSWPPGKSTTLPSPRRGPLARVMLMDSDLITESGGGLRRCPDQIFPVSVTATQTLDSVVLGHVPKWETARRQAFMDWLASGGTVHLLLDSGGAPPVFAGELTPLNKPEATFRVGAGLVVRHPVPRRSCDLAYMASRGFPAQTEYKPVETEFRKTEDFIFSRLNQLTRARHNWPLIYSVIVLYVIVVAPVNYVVARYRNWQTAIVFFLGTVVLFTALVAVIGRRGMGEASAVNTVAYARPLGAGQWDVTQWTNAFVVASKEYTIAHRTGNDLYSTCQDFEAVQGYAHNGADGRLVVEVPLFSSRAFQHRARMKAPNLPIELTGLRIETMPQREDALESISFSGTLPADLKAAWVCHRGRVHKLTWEGSGLRLVQGTGVKLEEFVESPGTHYQPWGEAEDVKADKVFADLPPRLVRRAVGGVEAMRTAYGHPNPKAAVHLFLYARAPATFNLPSGPFGGETGYVLYHLVFFKTGGQDG